MHDHHEILPGYHEDKILHDGCGECESRAAARSRGIGSMDRTRFARAWARAAEWNRNGLPNVAKAEVPLLDVLWAVQVQLENFGNPIGHVPHGYAQLVAEDD